MAQEKAIPEEFNAENIFKLGNPNVAYQQYFIGQSYLNMLTTERVPVANVTFEPGCRNNWHIHHKGGQILLVTAAPDSWFAHVAIEVPAEGASNEWCEPVTDEVYGKLK